MNDHKPPAARESSIALPVWVYGIFAILIGFVLGVFGLRLITMQSMQSSIDVLWPVVVAPIIMSAAFLSGVMCLSRFNPPADECLSSSISHLCIACGLGLGLLGLIVLAAGLAGLFNPLSAWVVILIFILVPIIQRRALIQGTYEIQQSLSRRRFNWSHRLLCLFLAAYALLIVLNNFTPVVGFDAAEYHLGGIREYIKAGRIHRIEGNFYTALPFQVEMLFGLGLLLEGGAGHSPKLINAMIFILCNVTMFALAGHITRRKSFQLLACLLFAVHPLIFKISLMAKNDLGLTLFVMLALLSWLEWLQARRRVHLMLMGAFIGFALGCKYTAIGMFLTPAVLCLIPAGFFPQREDQLENHSPPEPRNDLLKQLIVAEIIFVALALLVFMPWALKNLVFYQNPVYPLLPAVFQSDSFTPHQYQFYWLHHGGASIFQARYWAAIFDRIDVFTPLYWLPFLGAVALRTNRLRGWSLVVFAAFGHLAAALMTHNPDRFLAPLIPVVILGLILLLTQLYERRKAAGWLVAPYIIWALLMAHAHLAASLSGGLVQHAIGIEGYSSDAEMVERFLGKPAAAAYQYAAEQLPHDSTILLLYDAQWYHFPQRVTGNTVFDQSALLGLARQSGATSGEELLGYLREQGIDYLFVNEFELLRTIRQITPDRYLVQQFPGAGTGTAIRKRLNQREADATLLQLWHLYPPYLSSFTSDFEKWRLVLTEFLAAAGERQVFQSNPPPAPRIWIADLRVSP